MGSINFPLISVVFTSYNHVEYLKQALDSIVNQNYPNFEIIIIDDCSTDGSQSVLLQYEHHTNIILKLNNVNSGSYVKASNLGASLASGEYILFAQCDDYADSCQLMKLYQGFSTHPNIGVVFSRSNLVDENGIFIANDYQVREKKFRLRCAKDCHLSKDEMFEFLSFSCVIPNLSAALIKKSILDQSGGLCEDYLVAADWGLWLNISEICDFYYLSESLNNFRQHATTIRSSVKIQIHIVEIYTIFYNHITKFNLEGVKKAKLRVGAGAIWFWYFYANKKQWISAFPLMLKTIKQHEKSPIIYLILGAFKQVKESFRKKLG